MSLDEIQRMLDAQKKAAKKKQAKSKKKRSSSAKSKSTSQFAESLEFSIGAFQAHITKPILEELLQNIWNMDQLDQQPLDDAIYAYFSNEKDQIRLHFDRKKMYKQIRDRAFFQLSPDTRVSYYDFRKNWQSLILPYPKLHLSSPRKEFVQYIKNSLKSRWVYQDGTPLSEGEFQILYRLEREPKAIERLVEYLESNWLAFLKKEDLELLIRDIRLSITKIIKEKLLEPKTPNKVSNSEESAESAESEENQEKTNDDENP